MSRPRIYFGRNHGNEAAMHESENPGEIDVVTAVLINGNVLQILAGTDADDITVIINSANEHSEVNFKEKGFEKVAIIS